MYPMEDDEMTMTPWGVAVVAALGTGWTVQPSHWGNESHIRLFGPRGQRPHAHGGGYQMAGRVALSWDIPSELSTHAPYEMATHKRITVSADKAPTVVARDITRRLLPGLLELLARLRDRKAASDKAAAETAAYLAELAGILGARVSNMHDHSASFGTYDDGGNVEVYHNDDIAQITVRLPRETVRGVARAIAEARRG